MRSWGYSLSDSSGQNDLSELKRLEIEMYKTLLTAAFSLVMGCVFEDPNVFLDSVEQELAHSEADWAIVTGDICLQTDGIEPHRLAAALSEGEGALEQLSCSDCRADCYCFQLEVPRLLPDEWLMLADADWHNGGWLVEDETIFFSVGSEMTWNLMAIRSESQNYESESEERPFTILSSQWEMISGADLDTDRNVLVSGRGRYQLVAFWSPSGEQYVLVVHLGDEDDGPPPTELSCDPVEGNQCPWPWCPMCQPEVEACE